VDGYSADRNLDVVFYVYSNHIFNYGILVPDNHQPFNVTKEKATQFALEAGLPSSYYSLEAKMYWDSHVGGHPQTPYTGKDLWEVTSWSDPPWAWIRTGKHALVDPKTGQVYVIHDGGRLLHESQVDTPEEAAANGVDGYVKLEYPKFPQEIQIVKGSNYTFTFRVTFTSYNLSRGEVKLTVNPQYVDPYWLQSDTAEKVRGVLSYEPGGGVTLLAGETMNITATVGVPAGIGDVYVINRWLLNCLGIGGDGVLVLSDLEA
jgi:hypothetical protein